MFSGYLIWIDKIDMEMFYHLELKTVIMGE